MVMPREVTAYATFYHSSITAQKARQKRFVADDPCAFLGAAAQRQCGLQSAGRAVGYTGWVRWGLTLARITQSPPLPCMDGEPA